MAFGKKNQDDDVQANGRYKVDHIPVMISGKQFLQGSLDKHESDGWRFVQMLHSDKFNWILVVYERTNIAS